MFDMVNIVVSIVEWIKANITILTGSVLRCKSQNITTNINDFNI